MGTIQVAVYRSTHLISFSRTSLISVGGFRTSGMLMEDLERQQRVQTLSAQRPTQRSAGKTQSEAYIAFLRALRADSGPDLRSFWSNRFPSLTR
jgi:hypothetical protein